MSTEIAVALIGAVGAVLSGAGTAVIRNILRKIGRANQQIDSLKFLVSHMLTGPEQNHLRKIASRERFAVRTTDNFFDAFRGEIRHLLNMGFIDYHADEEGRDLFRDGEPVERRVDHHCDIKDAGREYLTLLDEILKKEARNRVPVGGKN